jgi:hypothetical protein
MLKSIARFDWHHVRSCDTLRALRSPGKVSRRSSFLPALTPGQFLENR